MTTFLLKRLAAFLTSSGFFEFVKSMVLTASSDDLSSEQKRTKVYSEAKEYGEVSKSFLINLVIELAYSYLKIRKEV